MKKVAPTPSYQLFLPVTACERYDERVATFWLPATDVLLQLSSYVRDVYPQVSAATRLSDRMKKHPQHWTLWHEKLYSNPSADEATAEYVDANGYLWVHASKNSSRARNWKERTSCVLRSKEEEVSVSRIFNGEWWSVRIPAGWMGNPDQHGVSFSRVPRIGTLQISAARRESGIVSDNDVIEFSEERRLAGYPFRKCRYGALTGLASTHTAGELVWDEWWLRHGPLLIYATYITPKGAKSRDERKEVISILRSLAARD